MASNRVPASPAAIRIGTEDSRWELRQSFQAMGLDRSGRLGGSGSSSESTWPSERHQSRWLRLLAFDPMLVEQDLQFANDYDLGQSKVDEILIRKRAGAQPDVQKVLDMSLDQQRYTMNRIDDHIGNVRALNKINDWIESKESQCLLVEGRRTATWPRVPLYVAASLLIRERILETDSVVLAWFATYHDRDDIQTMLKSLLGQLIESMNTHIDHIPDPQRFLQGRDIESTETLLQLLRQLLESQLMWSPVVLTIEGVEQYQLPGPRKPELDKTLSCLAAVITSSTRNSSLSNPFRLLLTAHHKIIGELGLPEDRHKTLSLRGAVKRFKLPVFRDPPKDRRSSLREVASESESESESEESEE